MQYNVLLDRIIVALDCTMTFSWISLFLEGHEISQDPSGHFAKCDLTILSENIFETFDSWGSLENIIIHFLFFTVQISLIDKN